MKVKRRRKPSVLVIFGYIAFSIGIVLQACSGKIDGSVLIPIPLIYAAMLLRRGGAKDAK